MTGRFKAYDYLQGDLNVLVCQLTPFRKKNQVNTHRLKKHLNLLPD